MKKLFPLLTLIVGFLAGYFLFTLKNKPTTTGTTPGGPYTSENSISQEEAQLLVNTFGTDWMDDANQKPAGKGEITRSIFLPLTKLDSLCAALDAARKIDGVTDGLRIYEGRYPLMRPDGKTPYEHPYHNTIIMVTTKYTHVLTRGVKDSVYIHLDYYGKGSKKKAMNMLVEDPQNRGELCPNNCLGATLVCPDPTNPTCTGSN
jgi:hypothetical protein